MSAFSSTAQFSSWRQRCSPPTKASRISATRISCWISAWRDLRELFAVALLFSGQNATLTGTLAGQIVMEGFLNIGFGPGSAG
jgi:Mn2+/Fe2+ NRAMP family transporter